MAVLFQETQEIIPEVPTKILAATLAATDVFILLCTALGIIDGWWQFAVFTVLTVFCTVFCFTTKITITADDEGLSVKQFKEYRVPYDHVIDVKKGDIDVSRNYSGWGIKKVKFKNYTAHGVEGAVTAKLTGRIVLTMTCKDPDTLYNILMENRREN